ncbi:MurR/RpiR family transcriptional regulator [Niveispirillum fermenti]|uniref:MurR/RpiR family transcriptional regulator n=1 Tax=Niveispirillum fermenti TaxID=1233113 RepID=UPI003A8A1DF4
MVYQDNAVPDDLLDRIEALLPSLSRSEAKIARKLMAEPEEFVRSSVRAIAADIGISEPTVVRFCRTIGCEGFRDLKYRIIQDLALRQAQRDARLPVEAGSTGTATEPPAGFDGTANGEFARHLHGRALAALDGAMAGLDLEMIGRAAAALARARKVLIYGLGGSSAILAQEMHNRLFRLGIASTFYTDSYMQRMSAATLEAADAAIFVSSTGRPRALQDSVELARYYRAQTVAITDRDSPLGRDADICLHVDLTQSGVHEFQPNPMRFAQLLMIDLLAYQVAESLGPRAKLMLRQTRASVASLHGIAPQQPIGD